MTETHSGRLNRRRSIRVGGFDYASPGAYFVTIATQQRKCLFGDVHNGEVIRSPAGNMINDAWLELQVQFPAIDVDSFVVMPNHLHGILHISEQSDPVGAPLVGARSATQRRVTVGNVVGAYKSLTTVKYAERVKNSNWDPFSGRLWQRNYYEHILRDEESLDRIRDYIIGNPLMWESDRENPAAKAVSEGRPQGSPLREPWMV